MSSTNGKMLWSGAAMTAGRGLARAKPRMRVHFVPRWPKNPYHAELARHLASCRVAVGKKSRLKDIFRDARPAGGQPEIVHLHALPRFSFRPAALGRLFFFWLRLHRLRRAGVKIVWTVHNIADHETRHPAIDRMLSRWCYRFADAVIVHSLGARQLIESAWEVERRHNVFVVHHGHFIDAYPSAATREESRARLGLPADALVFLFLGSIRPYKGVRRLVREFKAVAAPGRRLLIAGETLSDALKREIEQEIDGSAGIDFRPGFLADADLQYYMAATDVVVFPYTQALTSGALVLAMSFGRACIAPAVGALADTLDAQGGFLYDPADEKGLGRALAAAVERRSLLPSMGVYNRRRAGQWGWDEAARLTAAAYEACFPRRDHEPPPKSDVW